MTSFSLEFQQGGQVQTIPFDSQSIAIGRDRGSDFVLDHPTVSRQHALIVDEGGGRFKLVVLSRGGLTAVNGNPVEASEIQIYDGTELTFGQYTVVFRSPHAPSRPAGSSSAPAGSTAGAAMAAGVTNSGGGAGPSGPGGTAGPGGGAGPSGPGGPGGGAGLSGPGQMGGGASPQDGQGDADEATPGGEAGIMSWDEIAATSEEDKDNEQDESQERGLSDLQRMRRENQQKSSEGTNPVVVVGALLASAVLLLVVFMPDSDNGGGVDTEEDHCADPDQRVEVSVDCVGQNDCEQQADEAYERGVDLIERRAVERGNLFEGYMQLLKAEAYLEEAGIDEIPSEMDRWDEKHDLARQKLDDDYREFQVRYHQAESAGRNAEMANVISDVEARFPSHKACENRWARDEERRMKSEGIYPR